MKKAQQVHTPSEKQALEELTNNIIYGSPPIETEEIDNETKRKQAEKIAELATALMYGSPPILDEEEDVQPDSKIEKEE